MTAMPLAGKVLGSRQTAPLLRALGRSPLRVALVSEHASPLALLGTADAGGQNVHVAALATELARLGHEVVVHTRRDSPDLPSQVAYEDGVVVDHIDAGPPRALAKDDLFSHMGEFAARLESRWTAWRPDIVHAHFWMSGYASVVAAWSLEIPVVQTFHALGVVKRRHQHDDDTSPPQRLRIEQRLVTDTDAVIATCSEELRELVELGADPDRVHVVPCGVDLEVFHPSGHCSPRTDRPRLVAVSRMVPRKGLDDAIRALRWLPGVELVIAGGPPAHQLAGDPEYQRLSALAAGIGVTDRVEFKGGLSRLAVASLLRSADAVLCLPWYEPFGIVPLEAMACGVPVIGTAVGGLLDTVVEGATGSLVPPRRPDLVAAAAAELLADRTRRELMGRTAARRVAASYGWPAVARGTLRAYSRVLTSRALPREAAG
jgi:D-inositol-3-phosphate glycosyltransferase